MEYLPFKIITDSLMLEINTVNFNTGNYKSHFYLKIKKRSRSYNPLNETELDYNHDIPWRFCGNDEIVGDLCSEEVVDNNKYEVDPVTLTEPDYLRSDYFKINCDISKNNLALCERLNTNKVNSVVGTPPKISDHMSYSIENLSSECNDDQVENSIELEDECNSVSSVESSEGSEDQDEPIEITNDYLHDTKNKRVILTIQSEKSPSKLIKNVLMCLFSYVYNVDESGIIRNESFTNEMRYNIDFRRCFWKDVVQEIGSENLEKMNFVEQMNEFSAIFLANEYYSVMLHHSDYEVDEYEWTHPVKEEFEAIYVEMRDREQDTFITLSQVCNQSVEVEWPICTSSNDLSNKSVDPLDQLS
ncbi:unnamed protein product [Rotaria socialis]|uniref:Uncharacterized protein n=1 Tax=Rotaria socialis TaxID=392032 RepID=A0A818ECR4_9BILA|nr:unnamed protein product [Rotaria socialis]CAF4748485.1 unnamed protein product [Rotaria socialis]